MFAVFDIGLAMSTDYHSHDYDHIPEDDDYDSDYSGDHDSGRHIGQDSSGPPLWLVCTLSGTLSFSLVYLCLRRIHTRSSKPPVSKTCSTEKVKLLQWKGQVQVRCLLPVLLLG